MRGTMRSVCAWCKPKRPLDGLGPVRRGQVVSHTICEECMVKEMARLDAQRGNANCKPKFRYEADPDFDEV